MSAKNQEFWMAKSQIKFYQDATEPKLYPDAFIKCAPIEDSKSRDAQWSAVVSELKEALKFTIEESGTSTNYNLKCRNSLTKADQMLKEMGMKL